MDIDYSNVLIFLFFLILSGFFSSTETAFTAINRIRLKKWLEGGSPKQTEKVEQLIEKPTRLITAILIGNNFSNVVCSAIATTILIDVFHQFNITNFVVIMPIITITITIVLLVFGEITPKSFALKQPERYAVFSTRFLSPFMILLYPVINIFDWFHRIIGKLIKLSQDTPTNILSLDELKLMVDIGHDDGVIEDDKNKMLTSIFEFSDIIVREIMTPRTDTICISSEESIQNAIHMIITNGHSRIPVYEEKMDNIIGIIYAKDLLKVSKSEVDRNIQKFMRNAVFIPEYKPVDALLQQMKRSKLHMAIVVDEHGGMSGIITLEDIVEEIVGEIQDEYDPDERKECIEIKKGLYDVDAKINIRDLEDVLGIDFPDDEDFDTLGGLVLSVKGSFPAKGEVIHCYGLNILVKEIKKRRIIRLEITKQVSNSSDL